MAARLDRSAGSPRGPRQYARHYTLSTKLIGRTTRLAPPSPGIAVEIEETPPAVQGQALALRLLTGRKSVASALSSGVSKHRTMLVVADNTASASSSASACCRGAAANLAGPATWSRGGQKQG